MAMNSAVILAKENQDLQVTNEKKLQRRRQSTRQIACTEGFSIQEGQEILQHGNEVQEVQDTIPMEPAAPAVECSVQAPPRCSDCHIIGHRRLQCPNRNSN